MVFELGISISKREGVDVFDVSCGSLVRSFTVTNCSGEFTLVGPERAYLLIPQIDKAIAEIWCWRTGQQKLKMALPEKLNVVAASPDGVYIAGGTSGGKVYVWDFASGELLRTFSAHYKALSALSFASDGEFLVSGGEDSIVNVWLMADVVAKDSIFSGGLRSSRTTVTPWAEFSNHTLPVTGLFCTEGPLGYIVSSSLDRTCKIMDLCTRAYVGSVLLPCVLHSAVLDNAHHMLYCAGGDGNVYKIALTSSGAQYPSSLTATSSSSSSSGNGATTVSVVDVTCPVESNTLLGSASPATVLIGHDHSVTGLALSFAGSLLVSSSSDGSLRLWDTHTAQCLRAVKKTRPSLDKLTIVTPDWLHFSSTISGDDSGIFGSSMLVGGSGSGSGSGGGGRRKSGNLATGAGGVRSYNHTFRPLQKNTTGDQGTMPGTDITSGSLCFGAGEGGVHRDHGGDDDDEVEREERQDGLTQHRKRAKTAIRQLLDIHELNVPPTSHRTMTTSLGAALANASSSSSSSSSSFSSTAAAAANFVSGAPTALSSLDVAGDVAAERARAKQWQQVANDLQSFIQTSLLDSL